MPAIVIKILSGILAVAALGGGAWAYRDHVYNLGMAAQLALDKAAAQVATNEMQGKLDDANTKYRAAQTALATAQGTQSVQLAGVQQTVTTLHAANSSLSRLLDIYKQRAKNAGRVRGPTDTRPEWRDLFGECVARVDGLADALGRNTQRLGEVANDAAKWADKSNALIGVVHAISLGGNNLTPGPALSSWPGSVTTAR